MPKPTHWALIGAALVLSALSPRAQPPVPPVDFNCLTNQPGLTVTCPGYVPDLCALAAGCYSTNYIPGSCTQGFPPGMQFGAGNYVVNFQVQDLQSNYFNYAVPFTVLPQAPTPGLSVICPTNKTVECGSGWSFDPPVVLTSCCGVSITTSDNVLSNGVCSQVITRTWQILDGCGNNKTCSQTVTTVDTTPPGSQCGANLVPNGSFERFGNCPNSISMFDLAAPWFTPTDATTDLFSPCAGLSSYVGVPTNCVGVQSPLSGQCYAGAALWSVYGLNTNSAYRDYREYLEVQLLAPLTGGQKYQVSFYVSRADKYRYAIAEIGARLSPGPLTGFGGGTNFNVVPQVENPATNILASTNSWMLVQGTFTANGGESYLTLGNFRTDANTTWSNVPTGSLPDYAYYYFDDVSVIPICDPITNKTVPCGQPWAFDNVIPFDNCSGNNVTSAIVTTTNGVCPRIITRTWSLADQCGNSNTLTQTVTIVDTNPPVLLCAAGANLVPNPQFENFAWCPYGYSQLAAAAPWFQPTVATPDYLNSCSGYAPVSTPANNFGSQTPFSGQGYAGAFAYSANTVIPVAPGGYREYIEAPLLSPLVAGVTYQVSFRVSLADSSAWAIAEIGAYFSTGQVFDGSTQGVLSYAPQVVNPAGNPLTAANSWMLVQGTFTAAGGEDHITLGNFLTDANTTAVPATGTNNFAYYYYEDVSVVALCNVGLTNKTVQCGVAWGFDVPLAFDACSGANVTVTVASTVTNGVCPKVVTRTWALVDQCGNSNFWSQTVTIVDTNPPIVICTGNNLALNPGFESYTNCPNYVAELAYAAPWFAPTLASPDYFNACATVGSSASVPVNLGGVQSAWSGQGYAGAVLYTSDGGDLANSYREYIEAPLAAPLVAGQSYLVSFRVNLADVSGYAMAEISAYFSAGPVVNYAIQTGLPVVPQVMNSPLNVLPDTNAWVLVQGMFTAAGGEDHVTLGNFLSDAGTTAVPAAGPQWLAYYYFDDVSIAPICSPPTNKNYACNATWNFDTPTGYDACSGTNVTVAVLATVTNSLCPFSVTRTWMLTDLCGNSNHWSQTVNIANTNPIVVLCPGTNLVPNPGFESYTNCPNNISELDFAAPWYHPSDGTSDYLNTCATNPYVSVPANWTGFQYPFTGQGYAGAFMYGPGGNNATNSYREYLQTPLLAPLAAGQSYTVSFYVSRADNYVYSIANIGAHFSVGPMLNFVGPGAPVFQVTPQVENPPGNFLMSTSSWMLISGTFTAAGGEDHLTLGNFHSDANTPALTNSGWNTVGGYYYFDEVSVVAGCPPTNKIVPCGAAWTFDTPVGYDDCSGTNVAVTLVSTITNSLCPLSVTRNWRLTDQCQTNNWSQTVSVTNGSPLAVNCACLQDSFIPLLTTNGCAGVVPNLSVLTNSPCITGGGCGTRTITQSPAAGTVVGPGSHNITVNIFNCGGVTSTCVLPFNVYPPQPVLLCPTNLYFLTCNTGLVVNFSVTATGNNGNIVCTPPSGSVFPLGTNVVICTATNNCGGVAINGFYVIVRPQTTRWSCLIAVIGVIVHLPPSWVQLVYLPDFPGGGVGVNFENLNASVPGDVRFDLGPAQKFTFSTVLDFSAPEGARFDLAAFDAANGVSEPLLSFVRSCQPHCGWNIQKPRPASESTGALYRSIAISDEGELFSSFTQDAATLDTNVLASITSMNGATSAVMTVTLDCRTREVTLAFPECDWTPDNARKGWDGCIYGNGPRGAKTNKTARLILTPLTTVPPPPITTVDLVTSNLATLAFDNPSITMMGRKWGDGHVTLMKAYDDGEQGLEFLSLGDGGGVSTDLGHAAGFEFRIHHFENGDIPTQEEIYRIKGWVPGTTINRPAPPIFNVRLAQNPNLGGVDCFADFSEWGVSNVTMQLWNGTVLVAETNHIPAMLSNPLVTLSDFPGIVGCPEIGVLRLASTNSFTVLSGLNCASTTGCAGTELRILAELSTMSTPPTAYTGLECLISDGMDNLIYGLQTTPACSPVPLNVNATPDGIHLDWQGDGFRLQGAESASGPWYDLGVDAPVALPANYALRFFRLMCD